MTPIGPSLEHFSRTLLRFVSHWSRRLVHLMANQTRPGIRCGVPRYLLSGGVGRSWEWLTEVKPYESWRYDAIGKPSGPGRRAGSAWRTSARPHARALPRDLRGLQPDPRALLERRVHRFISKDN